MIYDGYEVSSCAMKALRRLRGTQIQEENINKPKKVDYSMAMFEEYDDDSFEMKVRADALLYKTILTHLNESYCDDVRHMLTVMFENVQKIYKHVNIKPAIYGANRANILNESDEVLEANSLRLVNDFVNTHYYTLTTEEREAKYMNNVKTIAEGLLLEGDGVIQPEDAVKFGTKTAVMEEFITRVNFPSAIRYKVEELLHDENYGRIFEQDALCDLWESFEKIAFDVAKIIASTI